MHNFHRHLSILLVLCLAFLTKETFASVLAIDYGADWIKASLMKPGVPFDVLLNKDSKRKIQSSVAWKNTDRLFASDAVNIVCVLIVIVIRCV
jgi:hypoxia up-regulated 1